MSTATYLHSVEPGLTYLFEFTNHRGETATRVVIARSVQWGGTPWHPELQFFLFGFDIEKQEPRSFPLALIRLETLRRFTDEDLDVLLSRALSAAEERGAEKILVRLEKAAEAGPAGE